MPASAAEARIRSSSETRPSSLRISPSDLPVAACSRRRGFHLLARDLAGADEQLGEPGRAPSSGCPASASERSCRRPRRSRRPSSVRQRARSRLRPLPWPSRCAPGGRAAGSNLARAGPASASALRLRNRSSSDWRSSVLGGAAGCLFSAAAGRAPLPRGVRIAAGGGAGAGGLLAGRLGRSLRRRCRPRREPAGR